MLPCRSGSRLFRGTRLSLVLLLAGSALVAAGERKHRPTPTPVPDDAKEGLSLKNIPLTVGHEAKGLILPNYDVKGNLLGRFEAATAARVDENHVHFTDLKMTTYDEKAQPDFKVDMSDAVLDLETRVLDSRARTKIKRADFEIAGDTMSFNTTSRLGTLKGHVHMTIFNQKEITGGNPKP